LNVSIQRLHCDHFDFSYSYFESICSVHFEIHIFFVSTHLYILSSFIFILFFIFILSLKNSKNTDFYFLLLFCIFFIGNTLFIIYYIKYTFIIHLRTWVQCLIRLHPPNSIFKSTQQLNSTTYIIFLYNLFFFIFNFYSFSSKLCIQLHLYTQQVCINFYSSIPFTFFTSRFSRLSRSSLRVRPPKLHF